MGRRRALLIAPVLSKLDHIRPSLHRLSIDEDLDVELRLIPLQSNIESRVVIFCDFLKSQKSFSVLPGVHSIEMWSAKDFSMSENWHSNWSAFLSSMVSIKKKLNCHEAIILLSDKVPIGITLASSRFTLIVPNLRLIEFPVGYDLTSQGSKYDPSKSMKEQMIEYETWTSEGIRSPLVEISKRKQAIKILQIIQTDAEDQVLRANESIVNITKFLVTLKHIKELIANDETGVKSRKTSNQSISNNLKSLKDANLIKKHKTKFSITETGLMISGILSNANE